LPAHALFLQLALMARLETSRSAGAGFLSLDIRLSLLNNCFRRGPDYPKAPLVRHPTHTAPRI
jgi:hypothetical protein